MPAFVLDFDTLADICRHQAVRLLVAFGSVVRGLRGPDSDLDWPCGWRPATVLPRHSPGWQQPYSRFFLASVWIRPPQQGLPIAAISGSPIWVAVV